MNECMGSLLTLPSFLRGLKHFSQPYSTNKGFAPNRAAVNRCISKRPDHAAPTFSTNVLTKEEIAHRGPFLGGI